MKTLLFTLEFPPFQGGVANYYGNLVKYWPREEKIVVLNNNQQELQSNLGFLSWWRALGVLKRQVQRDQIDYVLVGQILPLGTVTALLSLFKPLKYAVFLHGLDWSLALKTKRKKLLTRFILKRAQKIICANSYVAKQVADFYPRIQKKIILINPGINPNQALASTSDLQNLNTRYNLDNKTILFSLGRLVRRKGFDQVLQALGELPTEMLQQVVYVIAGQGPDEEYLKNLAPTTLSSQIIFLGAISEKDKWLWLEKSDIFIMPARKIAGDYEGFGIVYLEANLTSTPVIAGRSGGVADAVQDNYNGLLVDSENIEDLKKALGRLILDGDLRQKLGAQGRLRAVQKFNWSKQIFKLVSLIKQ